MAKKAFKCPRCKRTFSMKAHLVRHMSSTHGTGGKKKRKTATRTGKRRGRPATAPTAARADFGAAGFVADMSDYRASLIEQREALESQIAAIDTAISAMGGAASRGGAKRGRRPGRPRGKKNASAVGAAGRRRGRPASGNALSDWVYRVLSQHSKPMTPQDIAGAVVRAGYKTKAKDLTKAVSNALPKVKKVKRVGFGQYTV